MVLVMCLVNDWESNKFMGMCMVLFLSWNSLFEPVYEYLVKVLSHENKRKGVENALEIELCRKMKSAGETRAVPQARATRVSFCLLCKYRNWPGMGRASGTGTPCFSLFLVWVQEVARTRAVPQARVPRVLGTVLPLLSLVLCVLFHMFSRMFALLID